MKKNKSINISYLCLVVLQIIISNECLANSTAPWVGLTFKGDACQGGNIQYGPYDYTNSDHKSKNLQIVEEYHFSKDIEMLINGVPNSLAGGGSYSIPGSIDYTLMAFPNHHRALNAILNYQLIYKSQIDSKAKENVRSPVECYLQRAIHFSPKDIASYLIYTSYLRKTKHMQETEAVYQKALKIAPEESALRHSYGLFLVELKKYPEAMEQARIIYGKKYKRQKLKQVLEKSGHWQN